MSKPGIVVFVGWMFFLAVEYPKLETMPAKVMTVKVGRQAFTASLFDNPSAKALWESLPMTVEMEELNGNEKFVYQSSNLPVAETAVGQIEAGDIMIYGKNCLVIFYASFKTPYRYTKLGRIDKPAGLAAALGSGNVRVEFSQP